MFALVALFVFVSFFGFVFILLVWICLARQTQQAKEASSGRRPGHFWGGGPKMFKMSLLRPILVTSGTGVRKCYQAPKIVKLRLLGIILATSRAKLRKCSNWASWDSFSPFPRPSPENAQIEPSGAHFGCFQGQAPKMLKLSFLWFILATSRAKPRKCSNLSLSQRAQDFVSWSQGPGCHG